MLLPLMERDDVASIVAELLGPVGSANLRLVCATAASSFTSSVWAQDFWRQRYGDEEAAPSPANPFRYNTTRPCWYAEFRSRWGEAHVRAMRRARLEASLHARGLELAVPNSPT